MPTYNWSTQQVMADINLGMRVDRATATLPQTAAAAIFNIVGGRVAMTAILGEVTVVLGAVGNMSLEANPTVGTTAALCAVVAAGAFEAGTLLSIDGTLATAMLGVDAGGTAMQSKPVALPVGTLDLRLSASSTGECKWSIWYVPIDDGAYVTAA
jgi:hypothetical protein